MARTQPKVESAQEAHPPETVSAQPLPAPTAGSVQLYTLAEAAPFLRLGESTLRRLLGRGKLPRHLVTRIGGKLFMTGDQIVRVITDGATVDLKADHGARGHHKRTRQPAA